MARSSQPATTLELLDQVEKGDADAAIAFTRIYKPDSITDLIEMVWTDEKVPPPEWLFNILADAFAKWRESQ